jgi:hypothetical protein
MKTISSPPYPGVHEVRHECESFAVREIYVVNDVSLI